MSFRIPNQVEDMLDAESSFFNDLDSRFRGNEKFAWFCQIIAVIGYLL